MDTHGSGVLSHYFCCEPLVVTFSLHQVKNQEGGKKGPAQDEGAEKAGGVLVSK